MDPRQKLLEAGRSLTGEFKPTWEPKPDDVICGRLCRYTTARTRYGLTYGMEIDDAELGSRTVWLSATLLNAVREQRPEPGQNVLVKFHGLRQGAEFEYKNFSLLVDGGGSAGIPDFDKAAPADEPMSGQAAEGDWRLRPISASDQGALKRSFAARCEKVGVGTSDASTLRRHFQELIEVLGFQSISEIPCGSLKTCETAIAEWLPAWAEGGSKENDIPF